MKIKENVCEELFGTEQGMKECGDGEKESRAPEKEMRSAVPEKFKDVDALARAYNSLQAEFTRRSQRLKELERMVENSGLKGEETLMPSAAEKLRKTAEAVKAEEREFNRFVSELEGGVRPESEIENKQEPNDETPNEEIGARFEEQALEESDTTPFSAEDATSVASGRERDELSAEELYQRASRDESVRLKIIGEYLASVGKAGAPLTKKGGNSAITPPMKAKSIEDAGSMALRWIRNGK